MSADLVLGPVLFHGRYYFKWRFYFQEYNPAVHVSAFVWATGIGGNTAEYDVPQCPAGTPMEGGQNHTLFAPKPRLNHGSCAKIRV